MDFGKNFTQYIKTLFNNPKANVLTNNVLSTTFSLSRGCRQGCPSSPLLFALAIEPLAAANTSVTGIKFGANEHKLSLYADDLLLYITKPYISIPPLLECLKAYSAASGYKLNYTKSEILPLNVQDDNIRTLTNPLKWCNNGFKYLCIQVGKSEDYIFKQNYTNELNKIMNSFIWQKKNPRVKIASLQAQYSRGGLNLPNFSNYYIASQYRPIWIWLHAEKSETRWISIDPHGCAH
uniref:Reverse transcriptase domain-containing protein n=1 Tax=Poecilia mexicana TaxID=48701 RepID=A0A3B3XFC3_9TELE